MASVASATIVSNLEPADAKGYADEVRAALGDVPGAQLSVTGQAAIESDLEPIQDEDLRRGEFLIAIPIAFVILVLVFGTLAFLIPIVFALVHGNWWLTSIVWALMIGGLLVYTKSLGACIIAHAVTNLLLAGYVLKWKDWAFW